MHFLYFSHLDGFSVLKKDLEKEQEGDLDLFMFHVLVFCISRDSNFIMYMYT